MSVALPPVTTEAAMGSLKRSRVFGPLDLEIIDLVYEAAWAQVEARDPFRDRRMDGERRDALRKWMFALATPGSVDFDTLCDKAIGAIFGHDDQVVGLGVADLEFIDFYRPDIDAVGRHHQQFEAGNADIEDCLGSRIDDAQSNALAGAE